ncbi:DUF4839 domain-containing protein [Gordonia sp. UCD-TK1]|uniref:DUF4839 domain-containing protein n=1 Tax=Gordonia sp. UCD-TK1 TaxID=1857893 RepID=UPI001111E0AE
MSWPRTGRRVSQRFAAAHRGQTSRFPGRIGETTPHGTQRCEISINAGDAAAAPGSGSQCRDENATNDLHWDGPVPDTIGVETNLSITPEIDRYCRVTSI